MHRTSGIGFMARTAVIALLACVVTADAHPLWAEDVDEPRVEVVFDLTLVVVGDAPAFEHLAV